MAGSANEKKRARQHLTVIRGSGTSRAEKSIAPGAAAQAVSTHTRLAGVLLGKTNKMLNLSEYELNEVQRLQVQEFHSAVAAASFRRE